jgi:3-hydroxyisobutyrate dehydrogenase
MKDKRIAFVGIGRMGSNMARHLKDVGYTVSAVYDVRPEVTDAVAKELGAKPCLKLADVAEAADVIFTVVTDDAAMYKIFTEPSDNLLQQADGKIFVNCATLSPKVHVEVERAARQAGARTLEGCMASSISQARSGTLYLMVAGDRATFEEVEGILKDLSVNMRYTGGLGNALGIDLDMLREVFSQTGANSRVLETDGGDMQNREHECWFSASHAAKDSGIAVDLAKEAGLRLPLAEATLAQYRRMEQKGLGELDKSGVAELTFLDRNPG